MLKTITHLKGFAIRAADGNLGTAEDLYFDDESWTVRYLTVDTGGWLGGRRVLISPYSITGMNWEAREVAVSLTKKQVADSPDIDTHQPVSRQHEAAYLGYYGYPMYWGGPYQWGPEYYPIVTPAIVTPEEVTNRAKKELKDSHLRSTRAVSGYDIQAIDGDIGHVSGFVLDDRTWSIRYIEVATRNWFPGKKVLFSPAWIQRVSWISSKVYVALPRATIQSGPEYLDSIPITRDFENKLYSHYGLPPYWVQDAELAPALSLSAL
jgi:PRC-barrel domain protein